MGLKSLALSPPCACRAAFRQWRENAVAQADKAKKTSQAAHHYRRTLCFKVRQGQLLAQGLGPLPARG